jgi:hypothetical protein
LADVPAAVHGHERADAPAMVWIIAPGAAGH